MADALKKDLRLVFLPDGTVDLAAGPVDLETVDGRDNLVQALLLRLLTAQGELQGLGHPRYGSRIRELIGEPMDGPNLELLRRYVRRTLLQDPRVDEVTRVDVKPRLGEPGVVAVEAAVRPLSGAPLEVKMEIDVG
jgi:phage baseplate assembly protein W